MPNSFNISAEVELAAISASITIVDTVVDAIRATDVPNIQTNIDDNETKIDACGAIGALIRGTDVPNIQTNIDANETKIDANKAVVDAIRATDVPDLQTNINANETKIDANKAVVDAIRATDVPGIKEAFSDKLADPLMDSLSTALATAQDIVNITDKGILTGVAMMCTAYTADGYGRIKITIDGSVLLDGRFLQIDEEGRHNSLAFLHKFETSLLVQCYMNAINKATILTVVSYATD